MQQARKKCPLTRSSRPVSILKMLVFVATSLHPEIQHETMWNPFWKSFSKHATLKLEVLECFHAECPASGSSPFWPWRAVAFQLKIKPLNRLGWNPFIHPYFANDWHACCLPPGGELLVPRHSMMEMLLRKQWRHCFCKLPWRRGRWRTPWWGSRGRSWIWPRRTFRRWCLCIFLTTLAIPLRRWPSFQNFQSPRPGWRNGEPQDEKRSPLPESIVTIDLEIPVKGQEHWRYWS